MLEQKTVLFNSLEEKIEEVNLEESLIDDDQPIYLFTWSPDPKELPDSDIQYQNDYNVNILSDFLKNTQSGIICVEASQRGNPHYHGWYQIDSELEMRRLAIVKTLIRFGEYKVTKSYGHYKIGNWHTPKGNCLYYYKKDLMVAFKDIINNPITRRSQYTCDTELAKLISFFGKPVMKDKSKYHDSDKKSCRDFYLEFYADSRHHCR